MRDLTRTLVLFLALLGLPAGVAAASTPTVGATVVEVDLREAARGIVKSHLRIPVSAGPLTLVYPKWLPGRHGPAGPITNLAGPVLKSGGVTLKWRRDDLDMYAFHVDIPDGAMTLDVDFEVLTALRPDGLVNGLEAPRTATESLVILEWHQVVLYPAGTNTDRLQYQASVRLPAGWQQATALEVDQRLDDGARFRPVSLTTLVDSTLIAGRYLSTYELGGEPPVRLHVAADGPAALNLTAATLASYRRLVGEARALFGATHYRHYDFLYVLTDQIMPDGLEHHESSDNRSPYRTFLDDDVRRAEANLLPHEYTHSWNGKFRRPEGLATPNYQEPMRTSLLWVYEGLTEYLGNVLAARSGLLTTAEFEDELAHDLAGQQTHSARSWRNLEDATVAAQLLFVQPRDWAARLRRQEDFYHESALLWLEADVLIRKLSGGHRSLDDFCRRFFGATSGAPEVRPYTFDAVVDALNDIQPYEWRHFWEERLTRHRASAPSEGIEASGWRLGFGAEPAVMHRAHEADDRDLDLRFSLGFYVDDESASVVDVVPGSPGDLAGLSVGAKLVALDGRKWSKDVLHDALGAARRAGPAINLLIEKDGVYRTLELAYAGGERFPHLVRDPGQPDLLGAIARPRAVGN